MWVSRRAGGNGERVSTDECPVSLVTGASRAAVDEWVARSRIGYHGDLRGMPAKTVDSWLTLDVEREALGRTDDAERP